MIRLCPFIINAVLETGGRRDCGPGLDLDPHPGILALSPDTNSNLCIHKCTYIYIYTHMCIHIFVYVYAYIHVESERESE